jgi:hypothetical protein
LLKSVPKNGENKNLYLNATKTNIFTADIVLSREGREQTMISLN